MTLEWLNWCWNDRDGNPSIPASFRVEWPRNDFLVIPGSVLSFRDENEWTGVRMFPYRESKAKVLRAQKELSSSKAVELTMKPPASYLISTVRVTKLSSRNSSSTNLLYSLYLGLPAALLFLLLVILLAAYFYRPNSDNVQVHHLVFFLLCW